MKTRKRKKAARKRTVCKLPALSTLVKLPKKQLEAGVRRYETAVEVKSAPSMFSSRGTRLAIGPRKPRGYKAPKRARAQKLPKEIAHLFK